MVEKIPLRKKLVKKLLSRYRLVIINETTFEEQLYFTISRLNVIIVSSILFGTIMGLSYAFFALTPLKEFIPGKASSELNKIAVENRYLLDSITESYRKQSDYLYRIQKVLTGDLEFADLKKAELDTANDLEIQKTIPPNAADSLLRNIVSQEDKYNVIEQETKGMNALLFSPAKGPISQGYDPEKKHYAVDVVLDLNTPIKAIADGTVIFAEWTVETGYVIMVEHTYSLLSIYKHNASLTRGQGDTVRAGEVIAIAGDTGELSTGTHLHFELWSDGYAMNPIQFIDFGTQSIKKE